MEGKVAPILYNNHGRGQLYKMINDGIGFLTMEKLQLVGDELATKLVNSNAKPSKHISYQIELLEIINYEIKRYDKLGYCDFELSYICQYIIRKLLNECKRDNASEIQDFINIIEVTLSKKHDKLQTFQTVIINNPSTVTSKNDIDPLMSRFNKLTAGDDDVMTHGSPNHESLIEIYKYTEIITPPQLYDLLYNQRQQYSVLLIDFRTKNEFNYNHINYKDIVNIDPSIIESLLGQENKNNTDTITDQHLEERLKLLLPDIQYQYFLQRHKYDLIVIYNLRYGISLGEYDRFEILSDLLIAGDSNGNPSKQPFTKLIDLIAYRNKYISSKLKRAPCYLSGGVTNWFKTFGETSITKTVDSPMLARPPASISKDGNSSPSSTRRNSYLSTNSNLKSSESISSISNGSPYLKNFGDYLGTAKTTNSTPVSNPFISSVSNTDLYYTPSAPLKVPNLSASLGNGSNSSSSSSASVDNSHANGYLNTHSQVQNTPTSATKSNDSLSVGKTPSLLQVSQIKSSSLSSKEDTKTSPIKFLEQYTTGLTNLGNSCYMNCILQCLGATPQLTKFFFPTFPLTENSPALLQSYRQHINVNNKLGTKGILTTNFVNLLMNMFGNSGSYFTPSNFKKVVGSLSPGQQFANYDQQDCIEFLNFLLDSLHEDLNQMALIDAKEKQAIMELTPDQEKTREILPVRLASTIEWERYLKLNFSIVVDYFQGQYLSQLKCLECGLTSTSYNAFLILSLPIPDKLNKKKDITLNDCLQEFVELELLDEENKWHCPSCKKFTRLTKKITITRLPQVLIIHFKRFQISPTGYFSKLDTFINYPVNDELDLTSYWPLVGTSVNLNLNSTEVMSKEKESKILSTLPSRNQVPPFRYKLYGVANHFGNLTTGHYTAYVYKESDKKKKREWCYFDDSRVTFNHKVNDVLNKNAYCLFYQRV